MYTNEYLNPIRTKIIKKTLWSFDTEDDGQGNMYFGVIHKGKETYVFKTSTEFINYLTDVGEQLGKKKLYMIATNLEYDLVNACKGYYDYLEWGYAGRLIYAKMKANNIYFLDTLSFFPIGVKKMGKMLKLPKLEMPKGKKLGYNKQSIKYCTRDAEISLKFMEMFQDTLNNLFGIDDGAELKFTIASTAMNLYRRKFQSNPIRKMSEEYLEQLQEGYSGGRTEVWTVRGYDDNCKINEFDVNSLYPSMMQKMYPDPSSAFLGNSIDSEGMSCISGEIKETYAPFLPFKVEGRLIFGYGKFKEKWWTNFQIKRAIELGQLKLDKIHKSILFKNSGYFLAPYTASLYEMRKKYSAGKTIADEFYSHTFKILMNSLYGKFAEEVDEIKMIMSPDCIVGQEEGLNYYPKHSNFIWAIYTTAYGQEFLYMNGIKPTLDKGGTLYYCDTDSIFSSGAEDCLPIGKDFAQFKKEGTYKYVRFLLPKTYMLIDSNNDLYTASKGVRLDEQFEFIYKGVTNMLKPVKFREAFRSTKHKANQWISAPKQFRASYSKRYINADGTTRPIDINHPLEQVMKHNLRYCRLNEYDRKIVQGYMQEKDGKIKNKSLEERKEKEK